MGLEFLQGHIPERRGPGIGFPGVSEAGEVAAKAQHPGRALAAEAAAQLDHMAAADPESPELIFWYAVVVRPPDKVELLRKYVVRRPDNIRGWHALVGAELRDDGLDHEEREELLKAIDDSLAEADAGKAEDFSKLIGEMRRQS
jgi:uncharacterized protein YpiB (UPF0302 family)